MKPLGAAVGGPGWAARSHASWGARDPVQCARGAAPRPMVRHYDSEQEAYATRHELWEQRLQRERDSPAAPDAVPLVDRYMFDLQGFFVVRVRLPPRPRRASPRNGARAGRARSGRRIWPR